MALTEARQRKDQRKVRCQRALLAAVNGTWDQELITMAGLNTLIRKTPASRRVIAFPEEVKAIVEYLHTQPWARLEEYQIDREDPAYERFLAAFRALGPPPPMSNGLLAAMAGVLEGIEVRDQTILFYPEDLVQLLLTDR